MFFSSIIHGSYRGAPQDVRRSDTTQRSICQALPENPNFLSQELITDEENHCLAAVYHHLRVARGTLADINNLRAMLGVLDTEVKRALGDIKKEIQSLGIQIEAVNIRTGNTFGEQGKRFVDLAAQIAALTSRVEALERQQTIPPQKAPSSPAAGPTPAATPKP